MNISYAHNLITQAAQLVELAAKFQAKYGGHYTLKPGSPDDAWKLYDQIFEKQCAIARLLSIPTDAPLQHKHGCWWERQDVIASSTAETITCVAGHLIACVATFEVNKQTSEDWSYTMKNTMLTIAGMLHPTALQVASDERLQLSVG